MLLLLSQADIALLALAVFVFEARRSSLLREPQTGQMARVRLDPGVQPPALNATVHIHMYYTNVMDRLVRAVLGVFKWQGA